MAKLLFFAGSTREGSLNKKLAELAADMAKDAGAEVTLIDLKDYDMPLYNGDWEDEHGLPEAAKKLKQIFIDHDGFFIACPEYNSSITPLLKNTLDWITRPEDDDETPLVAFKGKVGALGAASPGGLGGLRGLVVVRMMLGNISVTLVPNQVAVGHADKAFKDDGTLKDEGTANMLKKTVEAFIETADKLNA